MEEMTFTESCEELVKIIQANELDFIETYAHMIAEFVIANEAGETPKMALALAKDAPDKADRDMAEIDSKEQEG